MEITANAIQTIAAGANIPFTETPVPGNCSIIHREGSGLVTLRGISNTQTRARFRITFGGNAAIPTGQDIEPIRFAIAVNGEPVTTTTMIVTPTIDDAYFNIFSSIFLDVPSCCCYQLSVENIGTIAANMQNANLIVERVA